jgi:hypothetical protein
VPRAVIRLPSVPDIATNRTVTAVLEFLGDDSFLKAIHFLRAAYACSEPI